MKQEKWQRIASPEDLDRRLVIITAKGWISLALTGLIILGVIIWTFFGVIPNTYATKTLLLTSEGQMDFFTFIPLERGQQIKLGTQVYVQPVGIATEKYGSIEGVVSHIAPVAATHMELERLLKNTSLITYFTDHEPIIVVVITPLRGDTPGSFKWTSGLQPPFTPKEQTLGKAIFILEQRTPISYIFPLWHRSG
jgi:hypothetical protein